ncbi:MAG: acyltransferase family protein [Pseudomonadales bacterium]|nr:acyltransferase family protein [Pseudomonadales bacterium]
MDDLRSSLPPNETAAPPLHSNLTSRPRKKPSWVSRLINKRAMRGWSVTGQDAEFMAKSEGIWEFLLTKYFRVSTTGWEHIPEGACMIIGVHSGTWLTMDAWMLMNDWWFRYKGKRILHGTAHDILMAMPGLGDMFRKVGVVPSSRESVSACLEAGHCVVIWPGGEVDSMRSWKKRHEVILDNRLGFVRQAIRSGVPIVPVATVGGAETVFVLSEGRWLADKLQLRRFLRSKMVPLVAGLPFGIWPELLPSHLPLPSKITNEFLPAIEVDPRREHDADYVKSIFLEVERSIQSGVSRLAQQRRWPILG